MTGPDKMADRRGKGAASFHAPEPSFDPDDPHEWIKWFEADWRERNPDGDPVSFLRELAGSSPGRVRIAEVFFTGSKAEVVALYHSAVGRPGQREETGPEEMPEGVDVSGAARMSPGVEAILRLLAAPRESVSTSSPATVEVEGAASDAPGVRGPRRRGPGRPPGKSSLQF